MEESILSENEFESDDSIDLFSEDPVFQTKEELDKFLDSCNIKREEKDYGDVNFKQHDGKECSCELCEDIWSGEYEHLCCQQNSK